MTFECGAQSAECGIGERSVLRIMGCVRRARREVPSFYPPSSNFGATRRNSKGQIHSIAEFGWALAGATRSGCVRPGQTTSGRSSGPVRPGQGRSRQSNRSIRVHTSGSEFLRPHATFLWKPQLTDGTLVQLSESKSKQPRLRDAGAPRRAAKSLTKLNQVWPNWTTLFCVLRSGRFGQVQPSRHRRSVPAVPPGLHPITVDQSANEPRNGGISLT
jgi:hypothetical protein